MRKGGAVRAHAEGVQGPEIRLAAGKGPPVVGNERLDLVARRSRRVLPASGFGRLRPRSNIGSRHGPAAFPPHGGPKKPEVPGGAGRYIGDQPQCKMRRSPGSGEMAIGRLRASRETCSPTAMTSKPSRG